MTRRRYTKAEKVAAIVAAEASSTLAASEQADIPRSTLRGWLDNPKYADLRQNAQEGMRDAARLLKQNLDEEKKTDASLSKLAESSLNQMAA